MYTRVMQNSLKILTTRQAATLLGVSVRRVCQFCESGRLQSRKVGRDWLIPPSEAERFRRIPRSVGRPKKPEKVKGKLSQDPLVNE